MAKETDLSLPRELNEHPHVVTGQLVGYARVSTPDQNLDRQIARLQKAGATEIYKEKISGASRERPQLEEMLRYLRKGDQLIVTSMDRLARSFLDLHTIVDDLVHRGVSVRFLRESQTYSSHSDPVAALMLGVLGSVAQFERAIMRERQAEGVERAKKRGAYKGRAKVLTDAQVAQARGWVADGVPKAEVARRLGIGRTTLYKYLTGSTG